MSLPGLLYRGSVKDVLGAAQSQRFVFAFSDRYSVFDWGEMPDALPGKGEALASIGDSCFRWLGDSQTWQQFQASPDLPRALANELLHSEELQSLKENGLQHHSHGLVNEQLKSLPAGGRSKFLLVDAVPVIRPTFNLGEAKPDYSAYKSCPQDALVPLEVLFRFGTPQGSSLLERAQADSGLIQELGLLEPPRPGAWLERPVVEFSSKLESQDRPLRYAEAQAISGMTDQEFMALQRTTILIALRLRDLFADLGIELWDGKLEFAFTSGKNQGTRGFKLVDSIGPDELRLIRQGVHLSKESLRRFYRSTEWYRKLSAAKADADDRSEKDWKMQMLRAGDVPAKLPAEVLEPCQALYPTLANLISERCGFGKVFAAAWPMDKVLRRFLELERREVRS